MRSRPVAVARQRSLGAAVTWVVLALLAAASAGALDVPFLSGRVVDLAQLVGQDARERLEERLGWLERETGTQMAVLTIPSLEGDSLEEFSIRVVETWQLGRRDIDDGVLILVARDDRKVRVEVGYGLEATLTDATCRRVIDEVMTPRFRQGEFAGGIEAAVDALVGVLNGDPDALPAPDRSQGPSPLFMVVLIFVMVLAPFLYFAIALRGGAGWFLYIFLTPFFGTFAIPLGERTAQAVFWSYLVIVGLLRVFWPERWRLEASSGGGGGGGGWSSSGGSWSSGSSGGGFSGGGGSFGGGGASGSW